MFLAVVLKGVSGNPQDEVAVSCFAVIHRYLSCYLPGHEQDLHHPPVLSVSFSRAEEFIYRSVTDDQLIHTEMSCDFCRVIWGDSAFY